MNSSEISTTEIVRYNLLVPQCPHPTSKITFWERSYLLLLFFCNECHALCSHSSFSEQKLLPCKPIAFPGSLWSIYTAPILWLHTHIVKNLRTRILLLKAQMFPLRICIPLPLSPFLSSSSHKHTKVNTICLASQSKTPNRKFYFLYFSGWKQTVCEWADI